MLGKKRFATPVDGPRNYAPVASVDRAITDTPKATPVSS